MSEAPERIYVKRGWSDAHDGVWNSTKNLRGDELPPDEDDMLYVPADALAALGAERDKLREAVREATALLCQVPRQINDSFGAGMEEREGGSIRRQGKLLDKTRTFESETKAWLAKHGGSDG